MLSMEDPGIRTSRRLMSTLQSARKHETSWRRVEDVLKHVVGTVVLLWRTESGSERAGSTYRGAIVWHQQNTFKFPSASGSG